MFDCFIVRLFEYDRDNQFANKLTPQNANKPIPQAAKMPPPNTKLNKKIMNNHIGYAFIGTPKGLQTKTAGIIKEVDIRRFIDLDSSIIKVDPNTEIFSIRKEVAEGNILYFISQYEYAKEIESQRTGTFFGSTIVLKNCIAPAEAILIALSELMAALRPYLSPDSRFLTTFDRIRLPVSRRLEGLASNLLASPVQPEVVGDNNLFIRLNGNNDFRERANFIHQCLNDKAFAAFQTVYASDDISIYSFVKANKTMRVAQLNTHFETHLEQLQTKYHQVNKQLELEENALTQVEEQKVILNKDVKQLLQKRSQLVTKYKETERSIVTNLAKMEQREKQLTQNIKQLKAEQQKTDQHYQASVANYEADQKAIAEQQSKLQTTVATLQEEEQQLQEALPTMRAQKVKLQQKNQRLMDDFELLTVNLQQLDVKNQEEAKVSQQLIGERKALQNEVERLEQDYKALAIGIESLKAEKEELEKAIPTKKQPVIELEQEIPAESTDFEEAQVLEPELVATEH